MSWSNLPATQATDWTQVDFLQQFRDAVWERTLYGEDPTDDGGQTIQPIQVGDNAIHLIRQCQEWVYKEIAPNYSNDSGSQSNRWIVPGSWDVSCITYVGNGEDITGYDSPPYVSVGGRYAYHEPFLRLSISRAFDCAGLNTDGFTRKLPLEIFDGGTGHALSITNPDNDPVTVSVGDIARSRSDNGQLYQWNGSGWVHNTDQRASPTVITLRGMVKSGDYIGPWLFNELQAVLNVMVEQQDSALYAGSPGGGTAAEGIWAYVAEGSGSDPDVEIAYDDAKTDLQTEITADNFPIADGAPAEIFARSSGLHDVSSFAGTASLRAARVFAFLNKITNNASSATAQLYWHWLVEGSSYDLSLPAARVHEAVYSSYVAPVLDNDTSTSPGLGQFHRTPTLSTENYTWPADIPSPFDQHVAGVLPEVLRPEDDIFDGALTRGHVHYIHDFDFKAATHPDCGPGPCFPATCWFRYEVKWNCDDDQWEPVLFAGIAGVLDSDTEPQPQTWTKTDADPLVYEIWVEGTAPCEDIADGSEPAPPDHTGIDATGECDLCWYRFVSDYAGGEWSSPTQSGYDWCAASRSPTSWTLDPDVDCRAEIWVSTNDCETGTGCMPVSSTTPSKPTLPAPSGCGDECAACADPIKVEYNDGSADLCESVPRSGCDWFGFDVFIIFFTDHWELYAGTGGWEATGTCPPLDASQWTPIPGFDPSVTLLSVSQGTCP